MLSTEDRDRPPTMAPTHSHPVLGAILGGRCAWSSEAQLRRGRGASALRSLEAGGWITPWSVDATGRPLRPRSWTLTPWAAQALGVELDERRGRGGDGGDTGVPYWVMSGDARRPFLCRTSPGQVRARFPDRIPDRRAHAGPEYLADIETGETTRDADLAARVLGVPALIDPRLGRRKGRRTRA